MSKRMTRPRVEVLSELYELPHLFGFWISDPEMHERFKEQMGENLVPKAYMFLGETMQIELNQDEDDEIPGRIATYFGDYAYEVDAGELHVQRLFLNDDDEIVHHPDIVTIPWGITDDGRLNLEIQDQIWRFIPATVNDLVASGFNREAIEHLIKQFRDDGDIVIETFTLEKARELIAEARRKEEEENGFGPDNPFEP